MRIEVLHAVSVRLGMGQIDWGANTTKITVNVTFATNLNSFIQIFHSAENKCIKEGATSVNSNCKSSHVASNFAVICIMFIRRVYIKS